MDIRNAARGDRIAQILDQVGSGKRNLLQKFELEDKAGSSVNMRALYAERSKTYVYNVRRILSNLYIVEGLE
jgi:hypothetical protein